GKGHLIRIEQMEHDDLMPPRDEVADAVDDRFRAAVRIGNEQDDAAPREPLDDELERRPEVALAGGREVLELREDGEEMPPPLLRRNEIAHLFVERDEPWRILLMHREMRHG